MKRRARAARAQPRKVAAQQPPRSSRKKRGPWDTVLRSRAPRNTKSAGKHARGSAVDEHEGERLSQNEIAWRTAAFVDAYPIFKKIPGFAFSPDDARRLLREFVLASEEVHVKEPLHTLVFFIREACKRYLSGEVRTLDQAFRLVRSKRGGRKRVPATFAMRYQLATEIEQYIKAGHVGRQDAIKAVSQQNHVKESYARDAHDELASYVRFRIFQRE